MSVVLTLNDASLSIVDLHAAMQQGCQEREGPMGGGGTMCSNLFHMDISNQHQLQQYE